MCQPSPNECVNDCTCACIAFLLFVYVCILVYTIYSMRYHEIVISSGFSSKAEQNAEKQINIYIYALKTLSVNDFNCNHCNALLILFENACMRARSLDSLSSILFRTELQSNRRQQKMIYREIIVRK